MWSKERFSSMRTTTCSMEESMLPLVICWSPWKRPRGLLLLRPLVERKPSARAAATRSADLELVDRMNLPERDAARIALARRLSATAWEVARIEVELTRDEHGQLRRRDLLDVLMRPRVGPVVRAHLRDHARTPL